MMKRKKGKKKWRHGDYDLVKILCPMQRHNKFVNCRVDLDGYRFLAKDLYYFEDECPDDEHGLYFWDGALHEKEPPYEGGLPDYDKVAVCCEQGECQMSVKNEYEGYENMFVKKVEFRKGKIL